jgi:hypothetical protein
MDCSFRASTPLAGNVGSFTILGGSMQITACAELDQLCGFV